MTNLIPLAAALHRTFNPDDCAQVHQDAVTVQHTVTDTEPWGLLIDALFIAAHPRDGQLDVVQVDLDALTAERDRLRTDLEEVRHHLAKAISSRQDAERRLDEIIAAAVLGSSRRAQEVQPVSLPGGAALYVHLPCKTVEPWNETAMGPIDQQGCDACEGAPDGQWRLVLVLNGGDRAEPATAPEVRGAVDVDELLAEVRAALAAAESDTDREEAVEELLEGWYAAWPDTALTSPHQAIAGELVRLLQPGPVTLTIPRELLGERPADLVDADHRPDLWARLGQDLDPAGIKGYVDPYRLGELPLEPVAVDEPEAAP